MKITLERLREIITEEVIKEELAPEIAAPAIAAMLQGTDSVMTSDIFGAVFDQMYGEGALEDEAERMAGPEDEPEEVDFPTEYQPGGGEGDRPVMGFNENMNEIIQEEYHLHMIEYYQAKLGLLQEVAPPSYRQSQGHLEKTYGGGIPPTFTGAPAVPERRPSLMSQQQVNALRALSSDLPTFAKKINSMVGQGVNIAQAVDFIRGFGVDPIEVLKIAHENLEQTYRNQSTHSDSVKKPELQRHETPGEYSTGIAGKTKQDFADERYDDIKRYLKGDMRRIRNNIKDMLKDYPDAAVSKK